MTEQQFYKELGQQVKSLREARGLNPAQLANKVGIPRSLLVRFEEDGKKMSAWRMNQLLKFFELGTLENLFHPEKKNSIDISIPLSASNGVGQADFKHRLADALRKISDVADAVIDEMHEDTKFSQPGAAREQHSQGGQQNHDLKTQTS